MVSRSAQFSGSRHGYSLLFLGCHSPEKLPCLKALHAIARKFYSHTHLSQTATPSESLPQNKRDKLAYALSVSLNSENPTDLPDCNFCVLIFFTGKVKAQ
jgi:hypothetical protein